MKLLKSEKKFDIRFSEVDSMGIVWHGSYALYLEDAREQFGRDYHLEYLYIFDQGYYAPLVELHMEYKKTSTIQRQCKGRDCLSPYRCRKTDIRLQNIPFAFRRYCSHRILGAGLSR